MAKKEFDLEKEVGEIARKSNFKLRQTEYSYEKTLKKLDVEMEDILDKKIKTFDDNVELAEDYLDIEFDKSAIDRYRRKLNKI